MNFAKLLKNILASFKTSLFWNSSNVHWLNSNIRTPQQIKMNILEKFWLPVPETFPKHRTKITSEAAPLAASLHPVHSISSSHRQRWNSKTAEQCEVLCQKLKNRTQSCLQKNISYQKLHCKCNGLLLWSLPFLVTRQVLHKTYIP